MGGGAVQHPERHSLAIDVAMVLARLTTYLNGLGGGMYWCRRDDFDAIGGFDERVDTVDDFDFARRLRAHGLPNRTPIRELAPGTGHDVVPPAVRRGDSPTPSPADHR